MARNGARRLCRGGCSRALALRVAPGSRLRRKLTPADRPCRARRARHRPVRVSLTLSPPSHLPSRRPADLVVPLPLTPQLRNGHARVESLVRRQAARDARRPDRGAALSCGGGRASGRVDARGAGQGRAGARGCQAREGGWGGCARGLSRRGARRGRVRLGQARERAAACHIEVLFSTLSVQQGCETASGFWTPGVRADHHQLALAGLVGARVRAQPRGSHSRARALAQQSTPPS